MFARVSRALTLASLLATAHVGNAQIEPELTLRLNDAVASPGGVAALVFRTYASRPVGQGQICVRVAAQSGAGGGPVAQVLGARVYTQQNDATFDVQFNDAGQQELMIAFESPTSSINEVDGPMAVIYIRLSPSVLPDQRFDVLPRAVDSWLLDEAGEPIPLTLRGGDLRVGLPNEPMTLSATAEATPPGDMAFLSVQTDRIQRLGGGQVGFRFDPSIANGLPIIRIDRRYGNATLSLAGSLPGQGLLLVTFDSPNNSLNRLPGDIISIRLPTRDDIATGTTSPVWLDPALTFLNAPNGQVLPIDIEADVLVFE